MSEVVSNQAPPKNKRKKMWLAILGVTLTGLGILWWYLTRPVYGTIHTGVTEENQGKKVPEKRLYQGKLVTFSHDGVYEERSHRIPEAGPVLESILLTASTMDGRKIAVTVANRGTIDLESDPSYQVRVNDATFERSTFHISSQSGVMFEKKSAPFEKSAFFAVEGRIVTVAVSALFAGERLGSELESLLADFTLTSQ